MELVGNKSKSIFWSEPLSISIGREFEINKLGSFEVMFAIVNFKEPWFWIVKLWELFVFLKTSPKLYSALGEKSNLGALIYMVPFSVLDVTSTSPALVKTAFEISNP